MSPTTPRFAAHTLRRAALVLAVAATAASGTAFAAPHGGAEGQAGRAGHGGMLPLGGKGMDRMLDAVQATPEQRAQIQQIAEAARADLRTQHQAGQALRQESARLFTQPTVDAAAVEALRQQMLAQHDTASQRSMQALLAVSQVLTPEQRQQIAARMADRPGAKGAHPGREHGAHGGRQGS